MIVRSRPRVPCPSLRWFLFPPSTIPPYCVLFPSRLFPVPILTVCPVVPSHPDVRTQFLPSRISLLGQLLYPHSVSIFSCSRHMAMDATGLCNCDATVVQQYGSREYRSFFFFSPPPLQSPTYHAAYKVKYEPFPRSSSQLPYL